MTRFTILALFSLVVILATFSFLPLKSTPNEVGWEMSPRSLILNPEYEGADTCLTLNEVVDPFKDLRGMFEPMIPAVSVQEEIEVGDAGHERFTEEHRITEAPESAKGVFRKLVAKLDQKGVTRGFNYRLHYLPDYDEVNAFTMGGHVYLTQGMMDYIQTDDELACVLSHELYHNELGHLNEKIAEFSAAISLGSMMGLEEDVVAEIVNNAQFLEAMLTPAFNQENELMCDLHGVDLAEYAGYDGCAARNFWLRMDRSIEFDFERLLSTHPGGDDRADCIHHHIGHFYNLPCN